MSAWVPCSVLGEDLHGGSGGDGDLNWGLAPEKGRMEGADLRPPTPRQCVLIETELPHVLKAKH